ncbi:MAG: 16S rRNA (guanine(527)-N(7))-methyltransferase RsmG [Sphingomicrobium sp.]
MIDRLSEIVGYDVPRETFETLSAYSHLLTEGAKTQNLISSLSIPDLWVRHIFDSAQLLRHATQGNWADIGSGAGLPGMILAILSADPVTLIEPRRLRVEFLQSVIDLLGLSNVTILQRRSTATRTIFDKITGRAVAPATEFFALAHHLSRLDTVWILLKGKSAQKELDEARRTWQGEFRLEASLTDPQASILLARGVRRRRTR